MRFATIVIVTLALATAARADKESSRLFEEGKELSRQGKYQEACDRFARSYELEAATGTQVNMADCEEHLGHVARAWSLFDAAANRSDREDNGVRAQYARRRATALLPRLGAIVVAIEAPDENMQVTVAGREYIPGPEIRAYVDPGEIEIRVQQPGKLFKKSIRVGAGESTQVNVPRLTNGSQGGDTVAVATTTSSGGKKRSWVIGAAVLGATGAGALGTAAVLTILSSRGYGDTFADGECMHTPRGPECTPDGLERVASARRVANIATGVAIGGTVVVVGAVIVYALAPKSSSVEVAPAVSDGGASVTLSGRW